MITRAAIVAAFETINDEPNIKTVIFYCHGRNKHFNTMQRVRVTRIIGQDYRVSLGWCDAADLKFLKAASKRGEKLPKYRIINKVRR